MSGLELAAALPWSEHFTQPSVYFLVRTVSLSQIIYCILHGSRRGPYLYGLRCGHQSSGALSADTRELSLAHAPSYGEKLSDLCLIRFPSLDRLAVHFYGRSYFPFPFEWIKKGLLLSLYAKVLKSISINKDICTFDFRVKLDILQYCGNQNLFNYK